VDRNLYQAWRGALLPLLAVALLLPSAQILADHAPIKAIPQGPSDGQIRDYNEGIKIWESSRGKDARERSAILEKAARSLQAATAKDRKPFAEAQLALGEVRYSQNNLTGANSAFAEAARLSRGPVRIEALTYLGFVALRQSRWQASDEAFEDALREDPRDYNTWSKNEKQRTELLRAMTARGEHFKRLARIGSLLASYYGAANATTGREAAIRALLQEAADRFPPNEIPFYQFELDDVKAALLEFPSGPVDFSANYLDGRPTGGQKWNLEDVVQGIRIWALAELAQQPQPGLDKLAGRDRDNAIAGLERRAIRFEDAGNMPSALETWRQLFDFPGINNYPRVALMSRQHIIWILLGQNQLSGARSMIRGRGAGSDPAIWDEQLGLAAGIVRTAPADGEPRLNALRAAIEEYRALVDGIPGVALAPNAAQRSLAEWNLEALSLSTQPPASAGEWERRLGRFPNLPGREAVLLYIAARWAETALESGQPEAVARALEAAERIAAGRYAPGLQPVPRGADFIILLRRFLAARIFARNEVGRYEGILRATDYGGDYRGWDAAKLYRARLERLRGNPDLIVDDPSAYENILRVLMEARTMSGPNADLAKRLDNDISLTRGYLDALRKDPPKITLEWNKASNITNSAKDAAAWQRSADAWRGVLSLLNGRPQQQRRDAAVHIIHSYMRQADVLYMERDYRGAYGALMQARSALQIEGGVGAELSEEDRKMIAVRLENNFRALQPAEELVGPARPYPPYDGTVVPPDQNRCVITRYPAPIDPDVEKWIENLRNRPGTVRRLVDWFNNGPMSRNTAGSKRNFSSDPNSPNYLVTFLDRNLSRTVGVLPIGSRQWCDHNGTGPWAGYLTKKIAAAYYLKNGVPIIRVACDNPLNPIRVVTRPARWMECEEKAVLIVPAQAPVINYGEPKAPFSQPIPQQYKDYVFPRPAVSPVEIIVLPPAGFYTAPYAMPLLPWMVCRAVGDC
jgi:hypothetical protein